MFMIPNWARPFVVDAVLGGFMVAGTVVLAWVVL